MPDSLSHPFQSASLTDVGRVRAANEDAFGEATRPDGTRLWVVADGMGGHRGGAEASLTAVETIRDRFLEASLTELAAPASDLPSALEEQLTDSIDEANERVFARSQDDPTLEGMGTTVVALAISPSGQAAIAHVGDSRGYRLHQGRLEQLTADHSVVEEMLRQGLLTEEEAAQHPRRNEILRSVGVRPTVRADTASLNLAPGDRILLCSDGLSGLVLDSEIESIVANAGVDEAVRSLVRLANERGGGDNITVQLIRFEAPLEASDRQKNAAQASPTDHSSESNPASGLDRLTSPPLERAPTQESEAAPSSIRRKLGLGLLLLIGLILLWRSL